MNMTVSHQHAIAEEPAQGTGSWLVLGLLFIATLVAQFANIAYESGQSELADKVLPSLIFLSLLTIPSLLIGVFLGKGLGLGFVNTKASTPEVKHGILFGVSVAILLGAFLLLLRWLLTPYLPADLPEYGFRGAVGGLLVSIGAAIGEEVWFRFGLMTLMLWFVHKLNGKEQLSDRLVFVIILVVGFGFGLAHLPQLNAFGAASTFAIWATVLGNISVSVLYGWCYWRYGLLSAIVAHFSVDIVLHVLPAFF